MKKLLEMARDVAEAAEILRINPTFSVEEVARRDPVKNRATLKILINAMREAGLPD